MLSLNLRETGSPVLSSLIGAVRHRTSLFLLAVWLLLDIGVRPVAAGPTVSPGTQDPAFQIQLRSGGLLLAVVEQTDGKILVGGDFADFNGTPLQNLARLNADGSVDASFQLTPGADKEVDAIAIQPDGKILVGGFFQSLNEIARGSIGRLNANGTLDTGFATNIALDNAVEAIAVQPDGKILVAGFFTNVSGVPRNGVARLNADGTLDPSFDPGKGPDFSPLVLALQTDGKVLIGGDFLNVDGVKHPGFARLNADGSLDATYQGSLSGDTGIVNAIALQTDGKALISGSFDNSQNLERFNPDGTPDASFNAGSFDGNPTSVHVLPNGDVAIVGDFYHVQGLALPRVALLRANGSVDPAFVPLAGGLVGEQNTAAAASAFGADGKLVVVGTFVFVGDSPSPSAARLNLDGSLDATFQPGTGAGSTFPAAVSVLTAQPDGKILVGGAFSFVNGVPRIGYARLNTDGSLDASFQAGTGAGTILPSGARQGYSVGAFSVQPNGKIIVGGYFDALDGQYRLNVGRLNADGSVDTGFVLPGGTGGQVEINYGIIHATALQPDGKVLIGGEFDFPYPGLSRLNPDGSLDTNFDPGMNFGNGLNVVVVQPNGQILVGGYFGFNSNNGEAEGSGIARLNPDGSADAGFNVGAGAYGDVSDIALQPDGRIVVGGYFSAFNNTPRGGVARLDPDGSLDTTFYPGTGADTFFVQKLALQLDGRILVRGGFANFSGVPHAGLVRLNANGSMDYGFDPGQALGAPSDGSSLAFVLQSDGGILSGTNAGNEVVRLEGGEGHPLFFGGEQPVSSDFYYLTFPGGNVFGFYSYDFFPYLYHADLGFEYFIDAGGAAHGGYLYDFASSTFLYTSPTFPFPYLYDFSLKAVLYYYPDPNTPGHYTSSPRYFYNFATGEIIIK